MLSTLVVAAAVLAGCGDDASERPAPPRAAVVWAVGDGATGSAEAKALVREVIVPGRPDRFLYLGDVYENGTAEEFARNYRPVYGPLDRITAPALGDHEAANREQGYDAYWREVRGEPFPPFHRLEAGGWEIVVLDTEGPHDAGSEQVAWLREQVGEPGDCRIAVAHRPRWTAGTKGDQDDVEPLVAALEGRARLLLSGDEHNMQRLSPRRGLVQLIAGSGGRELGDVNEEDSRLAFSNDERFGALRLELRPGSAGIAFVDAAGTELDRSVVRCRPLG